MKLLRFSILSSIFTVLFAVSVFSQVQPNAKIAVIDTRAFADEKGGIAKYIAQQKLLNDEFKPVNQELTTLSTKINALKKEISDLRQSNAPVKQENIVTKAEEHDKLVRELKFKQEEAEAKLSKRSPQVLGPITQDIFKAMQEFATQKGYVMILDAAKLDEVGLVLAFDRKYDLTEAFIKFYNARPATTATK